MVGLKALAATFMLAVGQQGSAGTTRIAVVNDIASLPFQLSVFSIQSANNEQLITKPHPILPDR